MRELTRSARRGGVALLHDARRRPRPLRIGVDIRPFYEPLTGVGWYLYELLERLALHEGVELIGFGDPVATDSGPHLHVELPRGVTHRSFDLGAAADPLSRTMARALYPLLIKLERIDVMFGGNYFLPRAMDAVAERRVVAVHDLTYRRHPDLLQAETLANLTAMMTRELSRADAVIAVSHATRDDLLSFYQIDASRVVAVQNGMRPPDLSSAPVPDRLDLPRRYLLFVSTIEPRKGLDTLIDAFESLRDREAYDGELVVAGRIGWKAERTAERLHTSRWSRAIRHLDYVPRKDLDEIYRRAEIFVLPSLYEGFGFPVLEAMTHGVPVITSAISSLPEVGGDAARYFPPGNSTDLARVIREVAGDPGARAEMVRRGREQAARFDWDRAARQTLTVLQRVAAR